MSGSQVVLIIALLCVSAFASSSETAFFSLNRFQLRRIRERHRPAYDRIRTLLGRPSRLLITILLLNEIVNLTLSSLITKVLEQNMHIDGDSEKQWLIVTFTSMFIAIPPLLLFGEIGPKLIAAKMNRVVAIINSKLIIVLYRLLTPLLWVMDSSISYMLRKLKAEGRDHLTKTLSVLNEDDIITLLEEGHREGTVDPGERKLIKNVFEFDDSTVSEVMTPIASAFSVADTAKVIDVLPEIRLQKFSRVPVYHKNKRHLVGILYVKDLLALRTHSGLKDIEIRSLMTRPLIVGPNMRLSVLFRRFKDSKTHMAIVVNSTNRARIEDGDYDDEEAMGVVTMEDVLESIFGEIEDERDVQ